MCIRDRLKSDIHHLLLTQLDLEKLSALANGRARQAVTTLIQEIIQKEKLLLNGAEKERLQSGLLDEVFGFGPLEPLLKDLSSGSSGPNPKTSSNRPLCSLSFSAPFRRSFSF